MSFVADAGRLRSRDWARLGAAIVLVGQAMAVPTLVVSERRHVHLPALILLLATDLPLVAAALALPWNRWHRRWLLVWPLWLMVSLAVAGTVVLDDGAGTLVGFFTVGFFYIGMTQPRWTSVAVMPAALPLWAAAYGPVSRSLWLKMPIAVGIWILIAETLAATLQMVRELTHGLVHEATTDPLTGLGNRRGLNPKLAALHHEDALVLLDVDHFKTLNDRLGHAAGDKLLADLAATIRDVLRAGDTAVRFGGDELLLVLPGAGAAGALAAMQRLRAQWSERQPGITLSAGVAVASDAIPATEALRAADAALYRAKQAGRDCWRFAEATELSLH